MAASETRVRKLDLAARAIDLTLSLMNATSSPDSFFRGAWEVGQWLGRERLNQYELQDCMQKAKGLVVPNHNGQEWCDKIIEGVESNPVGPLFLQQSGSLGRLMAGDPYLCWMISTVACPFQFHRDDRFVTETLTAFIMRAHTARQSNNATGITDGLIYNPAQIQIRTVITKIVSSVWYNVVNAGCDTIPLPSELLSVCHKGHYLDPDDFSIVTHTLYSRCTSKAVLRSDHLLRDIVLWPLLHYDGLLVVNVGGRIIYEKHFGNPKRELEIHVKSMCLDGEACKETTGEKYEILQDVAGKFENFLSGYSFTSSAIPPQPGIRQKLYEIPRCYPRESAMWNKGIQRQAGRSFRAEPHERVLGRNQCDYGPDDGQDWLQSGCLRRVALEEVMLLLAHGIADGFDVNDVSAIADLNPISKGITVILLELCKEKKVRWDSWFGLAASVYLGCPFEQPPPPSHPAFGGTAFAAIQYGNLAAQAPWLDLSNKLKVSGCFGLIGARGRLGVITKSSDHDAMQFRSVEENFAVIETEGTEDTSIFNSRFKKDPIPPGSTFALEDEIPK